MPTRSVFPKLGLLALLGSLGLLAFLLLGAVPVPDPHPPEGAKVDKHGRPAGRGWTSLWKRNDLAGFTYQPEFWKMEGGVLLRASTTCRATRWTWGTAIGDPSGTSAGAG